MGKDVDVIGGKNPNCTKMNLPNGFQPGVQSVCASLVIFVWIHCNKFDIPVSIVKRLPSSDSLTFPPLGSSVSSAVILYTVHYRMWTRSGELSWTWSLGVVPLFFWRERLCVRGARGSGCDESYCVISTAGNKPSLLVPFYRYHRDTLH